MLSICLLDTVHFSSILGATPGAFSFMHGSGVSSHIEAMQTMVEWMKTALEEGQANLIIV